MTTPIPELPPTAEWVFRIGRPRQGFQRMLRQEASRAAAWRASLRRDLEPLRQLQNSIRKQSESQRHVVAAMQVSLKPALQFVTSLQREESKRLAAFRKWLGNWDYPTGLTGPN